MSQNFKLKFDEMQGSNPTASDNNTPGTDFYDTPGHVRNLCFIWPDGGMTFLNYAYLISGSYNSEENKIILIFTSEKVYIKGSNLNKLFLDLVDHKPKLLRCDETRYGTLNKNEQIFISEITVE